jgi:hypothetical protein
MCSVLVCVCLQELANRLVTGEEAIYEDLPDVAAAAASTAPAGTDSSTLYVGARAYAVELMQVDPSQALKQLFSTLSGLS